MLNINVPKGKINIRSVQDMSTKKQVKQLDKMFAKTNSLMKREVILDILDYVNDYEDITLKLEKVMEYGLVSSTIGSKIYYSQTLAFYERHKKEINKMLYKLCNDIDEHDLNKIFNNKVKWDKEDPLALETTNQNTLAWFGYVQIIYDIYNELKGE